MIVVRLLAIVLIGLTAVAASAQQKGKGKGKGKDKDDVVGAIWHYKLSRGDQVVTGNFRVHQLEMFKGAKKIGVIKVKDDDEASFTVTDDAELNGHANYHKTNDKPRRVKGTLTKPNGEKWDLEIELRDK